MKERRGSVLQNISAAAVPAFGGLGAGGGGGGGTAATLGRRNICVCEGQPRRCPPVLEERLAF